MIDVTVLQHIEIERLGAIEPVLKRRGFGIRYIRTFAGEAVPAGAEALIVLGGPMGVYEQERYPFLTDELELIAATVAAGKPVLGICLGSQLLATALGGVVSKSGVKEIGWHPVRLSPSASSDRLWSGLPGGFVGFHWHGDIFTLPQGAVQLASSEMTEVQAFRHGSNAYGILFHPEVTGPYIEGMIASFGGELRQEGIRSEGIAADSIEHLPVLEAVGATLFERWCTLI